jgi:uncharacterized protein (TIGR02145 family)
MGFTGTNAGGKMKSTSILWNSPNTGAANNSGFSGLPAGMYDFNGQFYSLNTVCYFWSSNESMVTNSIIRDLGYSHSSIVKNSLNKFNGFSVRCLKD